jgi:hypothetical protein
LGVPDLFGGLSRSEALYDYLATLGTWTLDLRFSEVSGNVINYGTDGNTGAVSGATQGQTGQLGANEATLCDGVDDIAATFANADIAGTKALTTQRWCFLVNAATLGEGGAGAFLVYGNATTETALTFLSSNRLQAYVSAATTDAQARTTTGQVDFIGSWALVFVDYDDANALGLGRKIRLITATAASASAALTLAIDTAAVGAVVASANDLNIGNRTATDFTFDGLFDLALAGAGLWSPAGAPADLTICDQIRSIVFGV